MKRGSRLRLIWNIPRLLKQTWTLLANPQVSSSKKALLTVVACGYLFFPFDLVTDLIPVLGQIDDLAFLFLLLNWFVKTTKSATDIEAEYYFTEEPNQKNPKK